jgi:hypothetical protein
MSLVRYSDPIASRFQILWFCLMLAGHACLPAVPSGEFGLPLMAMAGQMLLEEREVFLTLSCSHLCYLGQMELSCSVMVLGLTTSRLKRWLLGLVRVLERSLRRL